MRRLLLLRHGQSTWNAQHRWQGWADPPLSDRGRLQAQIAAEALGGYDLTEVVSSDLRRARETAEIIAAALGVDELVIEPGLRERDVGEWSGLSTPEIEARWPGQLDAWRAGRLASTPGGELETDFRARITAALERVARTPGGTAVVVTHGGVIRTLERILGTEPVGTDNLCGRWVEPEDARLVAGEVLVLSGGGTAPTTVL